jgi:1,4-alpha-glucan branching enzyme
MHKKDLDKLYSYKRLGSFIEEGKTIFRIFAPQAERVLLVIYSNVENSSGKKYKMLRDGDGVCCKG